MWRGGIKYLETFRDIDITIMLYGPVVSVPASDPSSILTCCNFFGSRNVNHETFRDICSARREGGIGTTVVYHEHFGDMLAVADLKILPCT